MCRRQPEPTSTWRWIGRNKIIVNENQRYAHSCGDWWPVDEFGNEM
jgi:hypothetical protein